MESYEYFAANLKRLRSKRGWNQEELAARAGMDRTSISNLECRKHSPKLKTVATLATALGVTFEDLIGKPRE